MTHCRFYQIHWYRRLSGKPDSPLVQAPWCSHPHSPVSVRAATENASLSRKLKCAGDLEKCPIPFEQRPHNWSTA